MSLARPCILGYLAQKMSHPAHSFCMLMNKDTNIGLEKLQNKLAWLKISHFNLMFNGLYLTKKAYRG